MKCIQEHRKQNKLLTNQKETSKLIRSIKRSYDINQLNKIEQDFKKDNTWDFYSILKQNLSKYSPPSLCYKGQNEKQRKIIKTL